MKTCNRCKELKTLSEFYRCAAAPDGRQWRCKDCDRELKKGWVERNPERKRALEKQWRVDHPERNRAIQLEAQRRYRIVHREKARAHNLLKKAVDAGRLTRPLGCERCGASGRIEGHHADYSKPLDVEWLCRACHLDRHAELRAAA